MRKSLVVIFLLLTVSCLKRTPFEREGGGNHPVLAELFTNIACVHCPEAEEVLEELAVKYPNFHYIAYHIGAPYGDDPFYIYDSTDADGRIAYYYGNEYPGTPYVVFQGVLHYEGIVGAPGWEDRVIEFMEEEYTPTISVDGEYDRDTRNVRLKINPMRPLGEKEKIRIALLQSGVHYQAPNGDTLFNKVLRAMPGGYEGFSTTGDYFEVTFEIDSSLEDSSLSIIVFVQNDENHRIEDVLELYPVEFEEPVPHYSFEFRLSDTFLTVPPGEMRYTRIYLTNTGSLLDIYYIEVLRDSLPQEWTVSLCRETQCLPYPHTYDTLAPSASDTSYIVEFMHFSENDPPGFVWVKVSSTSDSSLVDSIKVRVE